LGAQLDGDVEIRIVENDLRILAAHLELHLGAARDARHRHLLAHRLRAGEAESHRRPDDRR